MANIRQRTSAKTGETTFTVQVRLSGFPTQTATFKRKTDAKNWAQQTEAAIRDGRYFPTAEAKRHTVNDLINRWPSLSTRYAAGKPPSRARADQRSERPCRRP